MRTNIPDPLRSASRPMEDQFPIGGLPESASFRTLQGSASPEQPGRIARLWSAIKAKFSSDREDTATPRKSFKERVVTFFSRKTTSDTHVKTAQAKRPYEVRRDAQAQALLARTFRGHHDGSDLVACGLQGYHTYKTPVRVVPVQEANPFATVEGNDPFATLQEENLKAAYQSLTEKNAEIASLKAELDAKNSEITNLGNELDRTTWRAAKMQTNIDPQASEIARLKSKIASLKEASAATLRGSSTSESQENDARTGTEVVTKEVGTNTPVATSANAGTGTEVATKTVGTSTRVFKGMFANSLSPKITRTGLPPTRLSITEFANVGRIEASSVSSPLVTKTRLALATSAVVVAAILYDARSDGKVREKLMKLFSKEQQAVIWDLVKNHTTSLRDYFEGTVNVERGLIAFCKAFRDNVKLESFQIEGIKGIQLTFPQINEALSTVLGNVVDSLQKVVNDPLFIPASHGTLVGGAISLDLIRNAARYIAERLKTREENESHEEWVRAYLRNS